jgi:antitoxin component HigA of HigAB toxin-antitoxin module
MKPVGEWTAADHRAALDRINELMDAEADTPAAYELEELGQAVSAYERKHLPSRKDTYTEKLVKYLRRLVGKRPWE